MCLQKESTHYTSCLSLLMNAWAQGLPLAIPTWLRGLSSWLPALYWVLAQMELCRCNGRSKNNITSQNNLFVPFAELMSWKPAFLWKLPSLLSWAFRNINNSRKMKEDSTCRKNTIYTSLTWSFILTVEVLNNPRWTENIMKSRVDIFHEHGHPSKPYLMKWRKGRDTLPFPQLST